jgi:hypothetical protein
VTDSDRVFKSLSDEKTQKKEKIFFEKKKAKKKKRFSIHHIYGGRRISAGFGRQL